MHSDGNQDLNNSFTYYLSENMSLREAVELSTLVRSRLRAVTECQIASTAWNANALDRKIPFTDRYVNFSRYLNNAPPLFSERNRVKPVLFAAQE